MTKEKSNKNKSVSDFYLAFKPPYPQTPVKKYDGKYMPVHNQKKV